MPAESAAAGERFARDMRRIREARDVTRDDIHEETRIATTLIDAFEKDGLFEHPAFNRVYLRSFVRAYAGCIDLKPETALQHLERALAGTYQNELAVDELGDAPRGAPADAPTDTSEDDASTTAPKDPGAPSARPQSGKELEPKAFDPRPVGTPPQNDADDANASADDSDDDTTEPSTHADDEQPVAEESEHEEKPSDRKASDEKPSSKKRSGEKSSVSGPATSPDDTSGDESDDESDDESGSDSDAEVDDESGAESGDEPADDKQPPVATRGPTHVADSSVSTTEDARLNTGNVFNKRPMGSGEADEEASQAEGKPSMADKPDKRADQPSAGKTAPGKTAPGETASDQPAPSDANASTEDDEVSPADRFRSTSETDEEKPPPPAHGEMVGRPRPVGSATDPKRSDTTTSGPAVTSPLTERERRDRAERDATGTSANFVMENQRSLMIGAATVGVLVVIGLIWFLIAGEGADVDDPVAEPAVVDTSAVAETEPNPEPERPPLANPTLGDSINVALRARTDLGGIRIQRDADQRRPYWMNEGQVVVFPFTERLIIWSQVDSVDIFLENLPYSNTRDDRGRVVITRNSATTFADTVRGSAVDYAVEPDTVAPDGMGIQ